MSMEGRFRKAAVRVRTPALLLDEKVLADNLLTLARVKKATGAKILLALKAFSEYSVFPQIARVLDGVCASGLFEAKLGREQFGKEVHTFAPAFDEHDFAEIARLSDRIVFNSFEQFRRFKRAARGRKIGIRVNPEVILPDAKYEAYNPCSPDSRLGTRASDFDEKLFSEMSGLHFHALCEQGADALELSLKAFEKRFARCIRKVEWVNFGGGHWITARGYDIAKLIRLINDFKKRHPNIREVYLEPGEAVVLNAGIFVARILEILKNGNVLMNASVEAHFPDVLITRREKCPYVPEILGADPRGRYRYIIGGVSCAAGDSLGVYRFKKPLKAGDKLVFLDAAHYSLVKMNTFNGINLPLLGIIKRDGSVKIIRRFGYKDYLARLS